MESDSGETISVWFATAPEIETDGPLAADASADVVVVGAGIAGMTTAYLLAREGRKVIVLDDGPVGGGMTGRTTAHLVNALDDRYFELERLHGERGARLTAESHTAAIDRVEKIVKDEGIECEFERLDGYLFAPPNESKKELEDELEACHRAGLTAMELVERAPIKTSTRASALRFPRQAQFHPLHYLAGLACAIDATAGAYTRALTPHDRGRQAGARANRGGRTVTARRRRRDQHPRQRPHGDSHKAGSIHHICDRRARPRRLGRRALYWDTPDPYHYVSSLGSATRR